MASIRIYIGRHLCTAPRPVKEADALAAAGHRVSVHGLWFDPRFVARDETLLAGRAWTFSPYADCRPGRAARAFRWWRLRLAHRLSREAWLRARRIVPDVYGYGARALRAHALAAPADLTIFHSEGGLWAAPTLRRRGLRTGVDFEDWFSRDLPAAARAARPVDTLAELEHASVRGDSYVTAASAAMAAALAEAASAARPPTVIYNAFPLREDSVALGPDRVDPSRVSLHWFSQNLGPARGLETLFGALPQLTFRWELHLRGDDPLGFFPLLLATLPTGLRTQVRQHPSVPNAALSAHIAQHDIGLALDPAHCPSRDLTVTNKLLQYLQSGLAIAASDTAGHREILDANPEVGAIFRDADSGSLARALNELGHDRSRLAAARAAAALAHRTRFAHELQSGRYAELASRALSV